MPIYEYACNDCSSTFEELVVGAEVPQCPKCESADLSKLVSGFAVSERMPERIPRAAPPAPEGCGQCGDPAGPGSCSLN